MYICVCVLFTYSIYTHLCTYIYRHYRFCCCFSNEFMDFLDFSIFSGSKFAYLGPNALSILTPKHADTYVHMCRMDFSFRSYFIYIYMPWYIIVYFILSKINNTNTNKTVNGIYSPTSVGWVNWFICILKNF